METTVLVAYATKYGATAEIADKIGQVLREAGLRTDVLPVDRVGDLTPYKAVVLPMQRANRLSRTIGVTSRVMSR